MACESLRPIRPRGHFPEQLLVLDGNVVDGIEGAQDFGVGFEAEGAEKNGAVEFALPVDADVEQILVVVFELDPASAIRDDLAEEVALCRHAFEEHAGRTVQLRNDDAFGTVDDEGTVLRHQRNFAEEDFLLLDVADGLLAALGILVENREANGDFERRRIGHAALFALGHVVLELQAHGIAAAVAERDDVLVERSAAMAKHIANRNGSVLIVAPQLGLRQVERRWCSPLRLPHLHSQLPMA